MAGSKVLIERRKYGLKQNDVYPLLPIYRHTYVDIEKLRVPITPAFERQIIDTIRELGSRKKNR